MGLEKVNRGDFYYANDEPVALARYEDRLVVRLDGTRSLEQLTAAGPFGGTAVERQLDAGVYVLRGEQAAGPMAGGISWVSPLFESGESGTWLAPTNEVIVALQPGQTAAAFFTGDARFTGYRPVDGTPDQFVATLAGLDGTEAVRLSTELQNDPRLRWASPNFYQDFQPAFTPNDLLFSQQWHLNNTGQNGSVPDADVDAPEAWEITQGGSPNVVIAVVDTGVDLTHPDLVPNLFVNPGEVANNGVDDDGNGYVDDVTGWDFTSNDNSPAATGANNDHGTPVAGIAAAAGNNGRGVAGVAYRSKIMPLRIFGDSGAGTTSANIAAAVYYAAGRTRDGLGTWRGADVMNNSWAGGGSDQVIVDAFAWASSSGRGGKGTLTFVASGNGGGNSVSFPANLSGGLSGVYAVGASNDLNVRASYSQYGSGLQFVVPSNGGNYGTVATDRQGSAGYNGASGTAGDYTNTPWSAFGGTSSASPLAAGIGALVLARDPNLTALQVRGLLRNTTDYIGAAAAGYNPTTGYSFEYGYGKLNAFAAVSGVGVAEIQVLSGATDLASGAATVDFTAGVGGSQSVTLRVRNQGTLPLTLGAITGLSGAYSVQSGFGSSTLAVGESTTFTLRFAPSAGGPMTQTLSFATNDASEGAFSITLRGTNPTTYVLSAAPTGVNSGPIGSALFNFSAPVDPASFSLAQDVNGFTGPAGNLLPFLTGFAFVTPSQLRVDFAAQAIPGAYALALGSQVLDLSGRALDQNRNGTPGEAGDGYGTSFSIGSSGGGPNAFGYRYAGAAADPALNLVPGSPGVTTLAELSSTDDATAAVGLGGNTFNFYGQTYTSVFVCSNGNLHFGTANAALTNTDLTTSPPQAFIAGLWDDLATNRDTATDDLVLTAVRDVNGDGRPELVVSFRNVHYASGPAGSDDGITFQIVLELNTGTRPGAITVNYGDLFESGAPANAGGNSATVGVKRAGSDAASGDPLAAAFNGNNPALVGSDRAIRFFRNTAPTASANGPYAVAAGGTVALSSAGTADPEGDPLTILWDLDGDGTFGENGAGALRGNEVGASPTYSAAGLTPGSYPVALRVFDTSGEVANAAATVSVTPGAAPRISTVQVNGSDGAQRSSVRSLVVTFDSNVTLPANVADAFRLEKLGTGGGDVTLAGTAQVIGGVTVVTLTFSGSFTEGAGSFLTNPSLVDGNYRLTARAGLIAAGGQQLDGDGNGTGGDDFVLGNAQADGLYRLFGDANGDRTVNAFDLGQFRSAFGTSTGQATYLDWLDFSGDGVVNAFDFAQLRNRLGAGVP